MPRGPEWVRFAEIRVWGRLQPAALGRRFGSRVNRRDLRGGYPRALGRRVSDEFTVPLCRVHHRELHRQGDEAAWWGRANIDPMPIALRFWQQTRGVLPAEGAAALGSSPLPVEVVDGVAVR
jgi:hypothetical protein